MRRPSPPSASSGRFRRMLILALVVVGAARSWGWRRPVPLPSTCPPSSSARTSGRLAGRSRSADHPRIEEAVNTSGHQRAALGLGAGPSMVFVTFDLDRDIDSRRRTSAIASPPRSPTARGVEPPVDRKQDNDASPVAHHRGLRHPRSASSPRSPTRSSSRARARRRRRRGAVVGGQERAINIWVDADRLAAYRLPITAVRNAMQRQNADVPGGNVTDQATSRHCARWAASTTRAVRRPGHHDGTARRSASATSAGPRTAPRNSARCRA